MCLTHRLPGFANGWQFLFLQCPVFWASVEGVGERAGKQACAEEE